MEAIYVFKCGCEVKFCDLIRKDNRMYRCPDHPDEKFDHYIKECVDCHEIITPTHHKTSRCESCQEKAQREMWKISNAKRSKKKKKKKKKKAKLNENKDIIKRQAVIDSWDCLHRDMCFKKYNYKPIIPCLNCKEYAPMESKDLMEFSGRTVTDDRRNSRNR